MQVCAYARTGRKGPRRMWLVGMVWILLGSPTTAPSALPSAQTSSPQAPGSCPLPAPAIRPGTQSQVKMEEHVLACHGAWCACWGPLSHTWSMLAASPDLCPCSAWPWWSVPAPTASPPPLLIGPQSRLMVSARLQGCSGQNNALFMSKQNTSDRANIFKLKSKA